MRIRIVPEGLDEWMFVESGLHDAALNSAAAAVHESKLPQTGLVSGANELFDDRRDVARRERVQIKLGLDRNFMNHVVRRAGDTPRRSSS